MEKQLSIKMKIVNKKTLDRLSEIHSTMCKEHKDNITLLITKMQKGLHGQFFSFYKKIKINADINDKLGTLCHEWSHYIALRYFGDSRHSVLRAKIQKYLMIRFNVKFRTEVWSCIPSLSEYDYQKLLNNV